MKSPEECQSIEEVRECIDALDREMIRLIRDRLEYARAIVRFKSDEEGIIARPRYESVLRERRKLAMEKGLDPDVIERMYRIMMDYFIEEELKIFRNNNKK